MARSSATALVLYYKAWVCYRGNADYARATVGATGAMPPGSGYRGPLLVLGKPCASLALPYTRAPATIPHIR